MLDRLPRDPQVQRQLQLVRPEGMSDAAWNSRIAAAEFLYREAKMHANYWLGLVHLESEHPDAAIDWFKTRTLETTPPSRWKHGARYNLARCYEQLGRVEEARQLYLDDESPQRLGNLMRARILAARATVGAP
jgi:Anaphase-promoting complex, cyclosome, subunit 3